MHHSARLAMILVDPLILRGAISMIVAILVILVEPLIVHVVMSMIVAILATRVTRVVPLIVRVVRVLVKSAPAEISVIP